MPWVLRSEAILHREAVLEREGYIAVPDGRVWYRQAGSGDGVPLLCLHGGPGASSDYLKAFDSLGSDRRVVYYDQIGGGKAEYEVSAELWRVQRFVEELQVVRKTLGLDRVHLYGHSWGNMLAVEHLLAGGNGVLSLTLAGPFLSVSRYVEDVARLASRLPGDVPTTIEALTRGAEVAPEAAEAAFAAFYSEHFCRDEAALAALFEQGPPGPAYEAMWGPNEFVCTSDVLSSADLTPRLGELDLPVLFLSGEHDSCTPAAARAFQSLIAGSEVVVLSGCSHMSMLEAPEAHVGEVASFISRYEGSVQSP